MDFAARIRRHVDRELASAATKTAIGWVPAGNTGGARVSPFQPMPIAPDLQAILAQAKARLPR